MAVLTQPSTNINLTMHSAPMQTAPSHFKKASEVDLTMPAAPSSFHTSTPEFLRLQLQINETDWAHSALPDTKAHLEKLEAEAALTQSLVDDFEKLTKDHQRKLQAFQHNHFKRLWHRTRGDLEIKIHKEEAISLQELGNYQSAKGKVDIQKEEVAEVRMLYNECRRTISVNEQAKRELKELLERLFAGPTPNYPSEDELEQSLGTARETAKKLQVIKNRNKYSLPSLQKALQYVEQAIGILEATYQIKFFDEHNEYRALEEACDLRSKAASLISSVHHFDPSIPQLRDLNLGDQPHIFSFLTADSYQLIDRILKKLKHAAPILQNHVLRPLLLNDKTVTEELQKCQTAVRKFEASMWAERTRIMTELLANDGCLYVDEHLEEDLGRDDAPPPYSASLTPGEGASRSQ